MDDPSPEAKQTHGRTEARQIEERRKVESELAKKQREDRFQAGCALAIIIVIALLIYGSYRSGSKPASNHDNYDDAPQHQSRGGDNW